MNGNMDRAQPMKEDGKVAEKGSDKTASGDKGGSSGQLIGRLEDRELGADD